MMNPTSRQPVDCNPRSSLTSRAFRLVLSLAVLPFSMSSTAMAEDVYNNFDIIPVNGWWGAGPAGLPNEDVGPVRTAQQFMLNGNDAITNVALQMTRRANPRGRVEFQIWEDDGSGRPGTQVGTLGAVEDIGSFPVEIADKADSTSFEEFLGLPREQANVTFDTIVSGLNPELPHYVVLDYTEASGDFPNNFGWTVVEESGGTNGASVGSLITTEFPLFEDFLGDIPFDGGDWIQTRQMFPEQQFFKMSVNATVAGDANMDDQVNFDDFMVLSNNFGKAGGWAQGDFDGDGRIDFPDFLAVNANFERADQASVASVPEPTASSIALLGLLGLTGFRKRR